MSHLRPRAGIRGMYGSHQGPGLYARIGLAGRWPDTRGETPMSPTARRLLAELDSALATAEELRYRLEQELLRPTGPDGPPPKIEPDRPDLDHQAEELPAALADLAPTGPGLWAWAKDHNRETDVTAIARRLGFPTRIIGLNRHQVRTIAAALARDLATETADGPDPDPEPEPDPEPVAAAPPARPRRGRAPRRFEPPRDYEPPY